MLTALIALSSSCFSRPIDHGPQPFPMEIFNEKNEGLALSEMGLHLNYNRHVRSVRNFKSYERFRKPSDSITLETHVFRQLTMFNVYRPTPDSIQQTWWLFRKSCDFTVTTSDRSWVIEIVATESFEFRAPKRSKIVLNYLIFSFRAFWFT